MHQISAPAKATVWRILDARAVSIHTGSVVEKPGVQALSTTAPDLHTGEIIANADLRDRSVEFIAQLRCLDDHDPDAAVNRVVPDNHTVHISGDALAHQASRP